MAITEEGRHQVYNRLAAVLGQKEAGMLMEYFPPLGWAEMATRQDMNGVRDELRGEMALVRTELRGEIELVRSELRGEIARSERRIISTLVFAMLASNATLAGLAFGAARLGR